MEQVELQLISAKGQGFIDMEKQVKVEMHLRAIKIVAKTVCLSLKPLKGTWIGSEFEFANIRVLKCLRRILDSQ